MEEQKKKKKSVAKRIALGVGIPVCISVLLLGTVCFLFYDGKSSTYVGKADYQNQEVVCNVTSRAFSNTKDNKKIKFLFESDDLNQILYNNTQALEGDIKNSIKNMYVEYLNDGINFCIDPYSFFPTRAVLNSSYIDGEIDGKNASIFTFNKISLGRLDFYNILVNSGLLNDESFQETLSSTGFSFTSDLKNRRMYYIKDNITSDIAKLFGKEENTLLTDIIYDIGEKNLLDFYYSSSNGLGVIGSLDNLVTNSKFVGDESDRQLGIDVEGLTGKVNSLLNAGKIAKEKASLVYSYLLKGYDSLSEEDQIFINDLDLTSIGIIDNSSYDGYNFELDEEDKIKNVVKSQLASNLPACISEPGVEHKIFSITEMNMNKYLAASNIVGTSFVFAGFNSSHVYTTASITVDNIYCNIVKDHIYYTIGINFNGLETRLIIDNKLVNEVEDDYKLTFSIEDLYFGETKVNDRLSNRLLSMLQDAFDESEWLSMNLETKLLEINLQDIVYSDETYGDILRNLGTSRCELSDVTIDDIGSLDVFFKVSL